MPLLATAAAFAVLRPERPLTGSPPPNSTAIPRSTAAAAPANPAAPAASPSHLPSAPPPPDPDLPSTRSDGVYNLQIEHELDQQRRIVEASRRFAETLEPPLRDAVEAQTAAYIEARRDLVDEVFEQDLPTDEAQKRLLLLDERRDSAFADAVGEDVYAALLEHWAEAGP